MSSSAAAGCAAGGRSLRPVLLSVLPVAGAAAQGDLVGLGDVVGLDRPESFTETLASLPEQVQRVGGGGPRSGAVGISRVLFDEVGLQGGSNFVGRLESLVNGPFPSGVVNHAGEYPHDGLTVQPTLATLITIRPGWDASTRPRGSWPR